MHSSSLACPFVDFQIVASHLIRLILTDYLQPVFLTPVHFCGVSPYLVF